MLWTILIAIYTVSAIAWYLAIRHMFTKEYTSISPTWYEVIITFVPFINTVWSILYWLTLVGGIIKKKSNYQSKDMASKFFGIKRT